jgi:hypothetical protein
MVCKFLGTFVGYKNQTVRYVVNEQFDDAT